MKGNWFPDALSAEMLLISHVLIQLHRSTIGTNWKKHLTGSEYRKQFLVSISMIPKFKKASFYPIHSPQIHMLIFSVFCFDTLFM